jgi:hypothetical protein
MGNLWKNVEPLRKAPATYASIRFRGAVGKRGIKDALGDLTLTYPR